MISSDHYSTQNVNADEAQMEKYLLRVSSVDLNPMDPSSDSFLWKL